MVAAASMMMRPPMRPAYPGLLRMFPAGSSSATQPGVPGSNPTGALRPPFNHNPFLAAAVAASTASASANPIRSAASESSGAHLFPSSQRPRSSPYGIF